VGTTTESLDKFFMEKVSPTIDVINFPLGHSHRRLLSEMPLGIPGLGIAQS